uniref:Amino acid transporter transmembrane domain-containing protein n=1 Tax=Dunaliella tertiolecta TaxID=3047 RepID=A0A7S3VGS3_DUNTE|mmetsp:Transcript_27334/g.73918  ORF Transcript_27334/g.73918 Transcript_27334/m.73918 type:complete len:522 (+) Transcript_27334:96-1661(+)
MPPNVEESRRGEHEHHQHQHKRSADDEGTLLGRPGGISDDAQSSLLLTPHPDDAMGTQLSPTLSSLQSVFMLCNSAIGAGVLSLPFAFQHAGLLGGILLCVVMAGAESFTMYVLSKFAQRHNAETYGSLVRATLGRKLTALLVVVMILHLFGSCLVYMIIIGDTLTSLGEQSFGPGLWFLDRRIVISFVGLGVLYPLCCLRRLGHLSLVSVFAVLGFMYTSGIVLYQGGKVATERHDFMEGVELFHFNIKALYAIPIVVFGFNCHANVVAVFTELSEAPDLLFAGMPADPRTYRTLPAYVPRPATTKLINMIGVIMAAMLTILAGYVCVGIAGYIGYPGIVGSNVLNSLPQDKWYVQTAQLVVALVVMGHYPLNHHPARDGMHDVLDLLGFSHHPRFLSHIFTAVFVGGTVGLALVVRSLGAALHVLGGTAASFMIFCLPGLMLVNAGIVKQSVGILDRMEEDPSWTHDTMDEPMVRQAALKGIKKTGLVYSPGKSWAAGIMLLVVGVGIFGITLLTAMED